MSVERKTVVGKVTMGRVSAVENLFGKYITDAKTEVTIRKERKQRKKSTRKTSKVNINKKMCKLRLNDIVGNGKDKTESHDRSEKRKKKRHKTKGNSTPASSSAKASKTLSNLAQIFAPQAKTESSAKNQDKLCYLISSLFNKTYFGGPKIIIKEKDLKAMKGKLLKNKIPETEVIVGEDAVRVRRKRRRRRRRCSGHGGEDRSTLGAAGHDQQRNRSVSKFSYRNSGRAEVNVKREKVRAIGGGDQTDHGAADCADSHNARCVSSEDRVLLERIQNLASTAPIPGSELAYVVQFSSTEGGEPVRHRKTISEYMEEAHFGGKMLEIKSAVKEHQRDEVNEPLEQTDLRNTVLATSVESLPVLHEQENEDDVAQIAEEFQTITPEITATESEVVEQKTEKVSKKANFFTQALRRCLCMGRPKSQTDVSESARPKKKTSKQKILNQLYLVDAVRVHGLESVSSANVRTRKRPTLRARTARKKKITLKQTKSSQIRCSIEWEGEKEGKIKIGKNNTCINFKIDRWAKADDDKKGHKSFALEGVLLPE